MVWPKGCGGKKLPRLSEKGWGQGADQILEGGLGAEGTSAGASAVLVEKTPVLLVQMP